MNYLLDTHVLVWWLCRDPRLDPGKRTLLNAEVQQGTAVGFSDFTLWEIALLGTRGRLQLAASIDFFLDSIAGRPDLVVVPVDHRIALDSVRLPDPFPRDPADRVIAATARTRGLKLVTQDGAIVASGVVATA